MITSQENVVGPLGSPQPGPGLTQPPSDTRSDEDSASLSEKSFVKQWQEKIRYAKAFWKDDYDRMRSNMDFVFGFQRRAQYKLDDDRYSANFTIRAINQKVATLYARNPKARAVRRQRLNYTLWDGKVDTLLQAVGAAISSQQTMGFIPPEAQALITDYETGKNFETLIERIGKTLEVVYQYQVDSQEPNFKVQAKQLVRRASVCGVSYIKVAFCRDYETKDMTQSETRQSVIERMLMAKQIFDKIGEGEITEDDAKIEQLKSLIMSFSLSPDDTEQVSVKERIIFDFPQSTSIIPDPRCRSLRGFVGAHWLVEEFLYPVDFVNAMFETDIKPGGSLKHYDPAGRPIDNAPIIDAGKDTQNQPPKPTVCLWQIHDLDTKSTFVICDGYPCYVLAPEVSTPATSSFWTHFALTLNDVETEPGCKATIFPPSDVQLMKSMQQEWNRTREALRAIRKANAPKYMCPKGQMSENDKTNLENAEDNQLIELENLPLGGDPSKVVVPLQTAVVDTKIYDTAPLSEDFLFVSGQQEANVGPAQPNVTATVGSIAEQSRQQVSASNVDDLDDCLSAVARCAGEMLLSEMSTATVQRIAGVGAVWPEQNKSEFLNQIQLTIEAASSGRPNRATEIANFERIAPLLVQAGANPIAIIRQAIKIYDDRLDETDFFPVPGLTGGNIASSGPGAPAPGGPPGNRRSGGPQRSQAQSANSRGQQQMHPASPPAALLPGGQPGPQ